MPTRSRTTFKKRQKEMARMEKQRDKAAQRMQRKQIRAEGGDPLAESNETDEFGNPIDAEGEGEIAQASDAGRADAAPGSGGAVPPHE